MASQEAVALANILWNKTATPIQIADGVKSLGNGGTDSYVQGLNLTSGSFGLASTTSSFVALYSSLASEGGVTARWSSLAAKALGAPAGGANLLLLDNEIREKGIDGTSTSTALNGVAGALTIAAVIPGLNVVTLTTLGVLSVGFTAAALFRGDSATLGQDFDTAIAKLQSMLPDNPTETQKLQLAETIDSMFSHSNSDLVYGNTNQFNVPVVDPTNGAIIGFRLESATGVYNAETGFMHYQFSDGTVLEQFVGTSSGPIKVLAYPTQWSFSTNQGDLKILTDDLGNTFLSRVDASGKTLEQSTFVDQTNGSYTTTVRYDGQNIVQRVGGTVAGQKIDATFTVDANGNLQISSVDLINGQAPRDAGAALAAMKEAGLTSDILSEGTSDNTLVSNIASAAISYDIANNSALENLIDGFSNFRNDINNSDTAQAINTYGPAIIDALSLVKAIQSGELLPVVASGLRLANDISMINKTPSYTLSGAANVASGVLSIMSLDAALKSGDGWAITTSATQTVYFAATAYASFAQAAGMTGLSVDLAQGISGGLGNALPYLGLAAAIATGDEVGIAVAAVSIAFPAVGVAYAIYSMIGGLFGGDDIPDPWGTGRFVWDGTSIRIQSAGETGGNEAVSGVMQSVITAMNSLIEQQRLTNPTSSLGIIANRMPSVAYDMSGYRYTDIDPLTGEERHPALRFDTSGNPYNATPGSTESYRSIGEAIIMSALERQAIAPMWEVQTAKMQTDAGDPKAGLTEETRAGRDGQLAAAVTGDTQTFRPVALDLNGNLEIDTLSKAASGVSFDVDDSGYLKETAWVGAGDAFLTLDRDYNGETNSGREMFSNSTVAIGRRGLAKMPWANNFIEIRRVG